MLAFGCAQSRFADGAAAGCHVRGRPATAGPSSLGALRRVVQARQDLRELSGQDEGRRIDDILGSVGLAGVADQLKDLRLGEGPGQAGAKAASAAGT